MQDLKIEIQIDCMKEDQAEKDHKAEKNIQFKEWVFMTLIQAKYSFTPK